MKYDEDTAAFMEKVADEKQPSTQDKSPEIDTITRAALGTIQSVATRNPAILLNKAVTAPVMKKLFDLKKPAEPGSPFQKQGSLSVIKIFSFMNAEYKQAWWNWEPETVWLTIAKDLSIEPDDDLKNVIGALQVVLNTHLAHEQWHIFEKVGHAFNYNHVHFGNLEPLELQEAALTYAIMEKIRSDPYEDDIPAYIASIAKTSGVVYLPSGFFPEAAQTFLDRMGNRMDLRNEVARAMALVSTTDWVRMTPRGNSHFDIQVARLAEVRQYVRDGLGIG